MQDDIEYTWKLEILTGILPAKIEQYHDLLIRKRILDLYHKIGKVIYFSKSKNDIKNLLKKYFYMIDIIFNKVEKLYSVNKEKITIIYFKNSRLKFDIKLSEQENRLYIAVPLEDTTE